MNKSESITKLVAALVKVQSHLKGAHKGSKNPYFNSSYADLTSVWQACRDPLADNGLAVVQTTDLVDGAAACYLETTLVHTSGEWVSGRLLLNPVKHDPQGFGSAITYARRYALAAIVGICPEDDDGNAASEPKEPTKAPRAKKQPSKEEKAPSQLDPLDWKNAVIHFGKNKGVDLGSMKPNDIQWYWETWSPKKAADKAYPPNATDKYLISALDAWHESVQTNQPFPPTV